MEYLEGTVMAREKSKYLEGTGEEFGRWSCVIDHRFLWKINEVPLP
jgi:hypothetical protein